MSCYICGSSRHKRQQCPERKAKIKCYECNGYGHYKNDCPIIVVRQQIEKENRIRTEDEAWFAEFMPNRNPKGLSNVEEITAFIHEYPDDFNLYVNTAFKANAGFGCFTHSNCVNISFRNNKIECDHRSHLHRLISRANMTLDEFLEFISKNGNFTKISHTVIKNDLKSMVYELKTNGVVKMVNIEYDREDGYYLRDKCVMRSRRHSTDYKTRIVDGTQDLICNTYDNYKNDGRNSFQDILPVKYEVQFLYI